MTDENDATESPLEGLIGATGAPGLWEAAKGDPADFGRTLEAMTADLGRDLGRLRADLDSGAADPADPGTLWRFIALLAKKVNLASAQALATQGMVGQVLDLVEAGQEATADMVADLGEVHERLDDGGGWDVGEPTAGYGD